MLIRLQAVYEKGAIVPVGVVPLFRGARAIQWPRGEDGSVVVSVVDEAGAAVDLTGSTSVLALRQFDFDSGPIFVKTGALSGTPTDGTLTFTVAAADTAGLLPDRYRYDAWVKLSGGDRHQVIPASTFMIAAADTLPTDGP